MPSQRQAAYSSCLERNGNIHFPFTSRTTFVQPSSIRTIDSHQTTDRPDGNHPPFIVVTSRTVDSDPRYPFVSSPGSSRLPLLSGASKRSRKSQFTQDADFQDCHHFSPASPRIILRICGSSFVRVRLKCRGAPCGRPPFHRVGLALSRNPGQPQGLPLGYLREGV